MMNRDKTNDSAADGTAERALSRPPCPLSVRMVAAVMLLVAAVNFYFSVYYLSTPLLATPGLSKGWWGLLLFLDCSI